MNRTSLTIVGSLLAAAVGLQGCAPGPSPSESLAISEAFLDQIAAEFGPFPIAIDEEVEMVAVDGRPAMLVYNYRLVDMEASEIDANALIQWTQPAVVLEVCGASETRDNLLHKGVTLRYIYHDKNLKPVASFDVTEATCGL